MARLDKKIALVTGCGSSGPGWGNGKAISVLFAREGAKVFGADLDEKAAAETRRLVMEEGGSCCTTTSDVTDAAQVKDLVEA
jgi:NAD(P)-dependent dehydrogenase (short-subunit alcohol dehydrogenase family)